MILNLDNRRSARRGMIDLLVVAILLAGVPREKPSALMSDDTSNDLRRILIRANRP
jgi:hypothetical protein